MSLKRALVVDDSRSARAFLTRILERHELEVDSAESAEEAIDYLKRQQPDVIFMDHLMPGMDGFQAVQAIKNDPRTSSIPILMYTSQADELYLSQARALGAAGVIPKQTRSADVSRALAQLDLLRPASAESELITLPAGERAATSLITPEPDSSAPAPLGMLNAVPSLPQRARNGQTPGDSPAALQYVLNEALESQAERIIGDVRLMLQETQGAAPAVPRRTLRQLPLALAVAALLVAAALALLWTQALRLEHSLSAQLAASQAQLASAGEQLKTLQSENAALTASAAQNAAPLADTGSLTLSVPFGEPPLALERIARIQSVLERLQAQGFRGIVQIRSFPGRFCLASVDGALLAAAGTPYAQCAAFASPLASAAAGERESPAFAGMLAAAKQRAGSALSLQLSEGAAEETVSDYPVVTDALSAGEWNRVAALNNRVEVRWHAPSKS
jgi:CheY-like chemotaxis protein